MWPLRTFSRDWMFCSSRTRSSRSLFRESKRLLSSASNCLLVSASSCLTRSVSSFKSWRYWLSCSIPLKNKFWKIFVNKTKLRINYLKLGWDFWNIQPTGSAVQDRIVNNLSLWFSSCIAPLLIEVFRAGRASLAGRRNFQRTAYRVSSILLQFHSTPFVFDPIYKQFKFKTNKEWYKERIYFSQLEFFNFTFQFLNAGADDSCYIRL